MSVNIVHQGSGPSPVKMWVSLSTCQGALIYQGFEKSLVIVMKARTIALWNHEDIFSLYQWRVHMFPWIARFKLISAQQSKGCFNFVATALTSVPLMTVWGSY
jgi:hypothetical protein